MTAPPITTPRPAPVQPPARLAHPDRLAVAALVAVALALRVPTLGRAYWIDEAISVGISSHPLRDLPRLLRQDGSPPLFYALLHFWVRLFGTSEAATHSLPLLISLAAVPAGYWAGVQLAGRRAGLVTAGLIATNPFLNWYATETRMYTLVVLLALLGLTFAVRAMRDRCRRDAACAVAAGAALLYTHDWGLYLVAAACLVLAADARRRGERSLALTALAGGGAALALWLPWAGSFLYQAGTTAAPWAVRPQIGDFFADPATALAGTLGFLAVPAGVAACWLLRRASPPTARHRAGLLAATGLATTAAGFAGALVNPSWTVRYLAVVVAPYLLAAGIVLSASRAGRAVAAALCAGLGSWAAIGAVLPNPGAAYAKDNLAAVARAASPYLSPGDLVVVNQTEQAPVAAHYLPPGLHYVVPTGPVSDPTVVDWRDIVARLRAASPCRAVAPALDALPVGDYVLEINPVRALGASGTAWARAVNGQVVAVSMMVSADPALTAVAAFSPALRPRPFAPVDGLLFRKTSAAPACG